MTWHSIHVYYYDEHKRALILDAVRPLFRKLAGHVEAASWTRHWRQGPHLRLNIRTDAATVEQFVLPWTREIVGGWLAEHPSTRLLEPDELLPEHRRLAAAERDDGPLTPWYPDNSIHLADHDRRTDVLGTDEMAELLADFYAEATPLSFQMTELATFSERLGLAFDLMVATTHALSNVEMREGFVSLHSHAEAFLNGDPKHRGLRAAWDRHYQRHATTLAARMNAVVAALDGGGDDVAFVQEWVALLWRYRRRAEQLVAEQRFYMPPVDFGPDVSPFHDALVSGERWARVRTSVNFAVYRLVLNYTYLHLTRLGVAPGERFLLCHLAANTAEDQYGVSAIELIGARSEK